MTNPNWEVDQYSKYYHYGELTIEKLQKLKDQAYDIDQLYRNGKMKEWLRADDAFVLKYDKLGRILLESAQANSCPYAVKGQ